MLFDKQALFRLIAGLSRGAACFITRAVPSRFQKKLMYCDEVWSGGVALPAGCVNRVSRLATCLQNHTHV